MSTEAQQQLDQAAYDLKLPKSHYKIRIIEATTKPSQNGNPMIVGKGEIFDAKPINGVDINGLTLPFRSVLTTSALRFVNLTRQALDLPIVDENTISGITPEEYIKCEGFAICAGKTEEVQDEITGEKMTNPYDGTPMTKTSREILEWIPRPKKS